MISFTCFVIVVKAIIFPFFYLKVKLFKLDKIKPTVISSLNKLYGTDIKPTDYSFDISIMPGGSKLSKKDKYCTTLAMSERSANGIRFALNIENNQGTFEFPVSLGINHCLNKLSNLFRIRQMVHMYFKKGELTLIQVIIELNTRLEPHINPYHVKSRFFVLIELTPSFELIDIRRVRMNNEFENIVNRKKYYSGLSVKDFFYLFHLTTIKTNALVIELLPELSIPSAYDFNSDDFQQRLLLLEMLDY